MTPRVLSLALLGLAVTVLPCAAAEGNAFVIPRPVKAFFDAHCYDCHDDSLAKGGLDLGSLSTDMSDPETFRVWERILDRVASGEMPPAKSRRQPTATARAGFVAELERPLQRGHAAHHRETILRRLRGCLRMNKRG